jgi:hypothetical protein
MKRSAGSLGLIFLSVGWLAGRDRLELQPVTKEIKS